MPGYYYYYYYSLVQMYADCGLPFLYLTYRQNSDGEVAVDYRISDGALS